MRKGETVKIMSILKVAYPTYYRDNVDVETAVNLWTSMFDDYDYQTVLTAVKAVIATSKYPPTIADVIEKVNLATQTVSMNEAEAWGYVRKAISNSGYNSREEFEKLPDDCKAVVCAPEQLKVWALMNEDEVNTVVASNFQRAYRANTAKREELSILPSSVKAVIQDVTQRLPEV